ncbi:hypothetical protein JCM11641_000855, partial [Rhodosporidiobolus odoratus]
LGCVIDENLTFKAHISAVAKKAATSLTAVSLLARAKGGMKPWLVRTVVEATAMKRLEWGAALWFRPGEKVSKALESVQRAAARLICGGYRTSSLQALKVEANLIPLDLRFRRSLFRLALRAHSAVTPNPLHSRSKIARIETHLKYPSPLHTALQAFPSILPPPSMVEPLLPSPVAPWEAPPAVKLSIAPRREEAIQAHQDLVARLSSADCALIYSDGSLKEGVVGAGALVVVRCSGVEGEIERSEGMGRGRTVYEGELQGAKEGLGATIPILHTATISPIPAIYILADNQSALRNLVDPSPTNQSINGRNPR